MYVHLLRTLWKNEKFTLTEIFFRQINSLVICLVNALLSRNFCQKSVRVNFRNFHTVCTVEITDLYCHDFFRKNSVKLTFTIAQCGKVL